MSQVKGSALPSVHFLSSRPNQLFFNNSRPPSISESSESETFFNLVQCIKNEGGGGLYD